MGGISPLPATAMHKYSPTITSLLLHTPWRKNSAAGQVLRYFISDFWVIDRLVCDGSKYTTSKGTFFLKEVQKHGIDLHITKPDCHNQSRVKGVIREMCKKWFRFMIRKKFPHRLWDYGLK